MVRILILYVSINVSESIGFGVYVPEMMTRHLESVYFTYYKFEKS